MKNTKSQSNTQRTNISSPSGQQLLMGASPTPPCWFFRTGRYQLMVSQGSSHVRPVLTAALKPAESSKSPTRLFSVGGLWSLAGYFDWGTSLLAVLSGSAAIALIILAMQKYRNTQHSSNTKNMPSITEDALEAVGLSTIDKLNNILLSSEAEIPPESAEEFEAIRQVIIKTLTLKELLPQAEMYLDIGNLLLGFITKYKDFLSAEYCEEVSSSVSIVQAASLLLRGIHLVNTSKTLDDNFTKLEELTSAMHYIAQALEEHSLFLSLNNYNYLMEIAHRAVEATKDLKPENSNEEIKFNFYKKILKRSVRSMLLIVEEFEKKEKEKQEDIEYERKVQNLFSDTESYEYMMRQWQLFSEKWSEIVVDYCGKYILFEDGKVVDWDEDSDTLIDRVRAKTGPRTLFTKFVSSVDPRTVDTPFNRINKRKHKK